MALLRVLEAALARHHEADCSSFSPDASSHYKELKVHILVEKGCLEGQLLLFLQRSAQGREKSIRALWVSHIWKAQDLLSFDLWEPLQQGRWLLQAALCSSSAYAYVFLTIFTLIRRSGLGFH